MDDRGLIRKGPLLARLARKYVEADGTLLCRNLEGEEDLVELRIKAGGPVFRMLASEFDQAVELVKKHPS